MFIELPNETRVNTDHITTYSICERDGELRIYLRDGELQIRQSFDTEDEAKLTLYALDRAIGVKPLIIRK